MKKYSNNLTFVFVLLIILLPNTSSAQPLENKEAPIEISADNSLEWLQNKQQYIANGHVKVKQGNAEIYSDTLTADYRENKASGKTEIWQLTAQGNVSIKNEDSHAQGDVATYNIDTSMTTMTGNNLKLILPEQTITANDRMEYNINDGTAKAVGMAQIIRQNDQINANIINANFSKDTTGKQKLNKATATGNVTIKTKDETLTGHNATYNALNNTAEITGNVKIKRGPNTLEGARAQVNLKTNISQIFGSPKTGKRVKGVFFPSTQPEKEK